MELRSLFTHELANYSRERQYEPWEIYLQYAYRKRVEVSNSLIEQLLPQSIRAGTPTGFELKVLLFIIVIYERIRSFLLF